MSWLKLEDKQKSAIIGVSFLLVILSGALLMLVQNPIWIGICLGSIIGFGLTGFIFYMMFLWDFIEGQKISDELWKRYKELEKE